MDNYFNLTSGTLDQISIYRTTSGSSCYIADIESRTLIYKGFILNDKPTTQTICELDFHPSGTSGKYVPRLTFKKTKKTTGETKENPLSKDFVRISFATSDDGYEYFWRMIEFLNKFRDLVDVGDFEKSYKVVDSESFILQFKDKNQAEKITQLSKILTNGNLDAESIRVALLKTREETITQFSLLLNENKFEEYRQRFPGDIKGLGEEAIWHHFLKKNLWIIGLGIDIRFIRDLISETNVGIQSTNGTGSPSADLMCITDYTLLVELKTSTTNIFTSTKQNTSRTNTWSFTSGFIDGISQCLGQKTDWEKSHALKAISGDNGAVLDQREIRTVDPKTVFIIGNKSKEFSDKLHTEDNMCKRDTFERFRRNNRNVDVVTFDELYEKAYYIVYGKRPSCSK